MFRLVILTALVLCLAFAASASALTSPRPHNFVKPNPHNFLKHPMPHNFAPTRNAT